MSMAAAVASTLKDWMGGVSDGRITSLGVFADGQLTFCCHFLHLLYFLPRDAKHSVIMRLYTSSVCPSVRL